MRKYVFGTGILGVITSGLALLRTARDEGPFTWRVAMAWASWAITLVLAVGTIVDIRRASRGGLVAEDSPIAGKEEKYLREHIEQ